MALTTSSAATLDDVATHAERIAADVVWATMATVGPDGVPRTRVVHPVLRWDDGAPRGWVTSRPTALRRRHLSASPWVSLTWWSPAQDVLTVDCHAAWVADDEVVDVWDRIASTPEPVGFDPATIWPDGPGSGFAAIALRAHRVRVAPVADAAAGRPALLWTEPACD
ncbi:pyridoxamine 5'-phosphate oxidase family protein [Dermatobacter hominis]|uniref:pyridoxamine 5'-phosphate oxidase family protein n=1 Tax=Dermatobacter hominis TaxID=2884263 RepID=UPI001D0F655D|nr:pyridoxamine 5'-phosphate oxidase family protein [Dermatobacter hominis]UDY34189.1 pyridoxamine 5'-phosphate oxidase family protein [Dermatobacter hominis]